MSKWTDDYLDRIKNSYGSNIYANNSSNTEPGYLESAWGNFKGGLEAATGGIANFIGANLNAAKNSELLNALMSAQGLKADLEAKNNGNFYSGDAVYKPITNNDPTPYASTINKIADSVLNEGAYLNNAANENLAKYGSRDTYGGLTDRILNADYWLDPRGAIADISQGIGSSVPSIGASLIIPGSGVAVRAGSLAQKGVGLLGGLTGKKLAAEAIGKRVGSVMSTGVKWGVGGGGMEAISDAGSIYDDLKSQGYDDEAIAKTINNLALNEAPYLMASDALTGALLTGKIGNVIKNNKYIGGNGIGKAALRTGLIGIPTSMASEYATEMKQTQLQKEYTNKPYGTFFNPMPDETQAGAMGAIGALGFAGIGGIRGGINRGYNHFIKDNSKIDIPSVTIGNNGDNQPSNTEIPSGVENEAAYRAAQVAANDIGRPDLAPIIYSQWALESGRFKSGNAVRTNNFGGLKRTDTSENILQSFNSPEEFGHEYAKQTLAHYDLSNVKTPRDFVHVLKENNYFGSDENEYANNVESIYNELGVSDTNTNFDMPDKQYYNITGEVSDTGLTSLTEQKLNLLARDFYNRFGYNLDVTSMKRNGNGNSWHDSGQAIDVVSDVLANDPEARAWLIEQGQRYGLVALDEYANPSAHATGGHIHFSDHGDPLPNRSSRNNNNGNINIKFNNKHFNDTSFDLKGNDIPSTKDLQAEDIEVNQPAKANNANRQINGQDNNKDIWDFVDDEIEQSFASGDTAYLEKLRTVKGNNKVNEAQSLIKQAKKSYLEKLKDDFSNFNGSQQGILNDTYNKMRKSYEANDMAAALNLANNIEQLKAEFNRGYAIRDKTDSENHLWTDEDKPKSKKVVEQTNTTLKEVGNTLLNDLQTQNIPVNTEAIQKALNSNDINKQKDALTFMQMQQILAEPRLLKEQKQRLRNVVNQFLAKQTQPIYNNISKMASPNYMYNSDMGIDSSQQNTANIPDNNINTEKINDMINQSADSFINNQPNSTQENIDDLSKNIGQLLQPDYVENENNIKERGQRIKNIFDKIQSMQEYDNFVQSLSEEERLFMDYLDYTFENTGKSFDDVLNYLKQERMADINTYIDVLRSQMKQGVAKRGVAYNKNTGEYTNYPGFSNNYQWYRDMMATNNYRNMKKSDLDNYLYDTAKEHLSYGYIDPQYGEQIPQEVTTEFIRRESAINGLESIANKAIKYEQGRQLQGKNQASGGQGYGNIQQEKSDQIDITTAKDLGNLLYEKIQEQEIKVNNANIEQALNSNNPKQQQKAIDFMKKKLDDKVSSNEDKIDFEKKSKKVVTDNGDNPKEQQENIDFKQKKPDDEVSAEDNIDFKGKSSKVITDNGQEFNTNFKIIEADDLITSHSAKNGFKVNPKYPKHLQPRNRERNVMKQQITEMTNKLRPEDLADSRNVNNGAPIIDKNNIVLNGNGRSMAIIRALKGISTRDTTGKKYKEYLMKHAEEFGYTKEEIAKIKNPVLVRQIEQNLNDDETKEVINSTAGGARMAASEQAISDADKIKLNSLDLYVDNEQGDITTAANKEFVMAILTDISSKNDLNALLDEKGNVNADGLLRVKRALFSLAYGDDNLIAKMSESTNDNIRNITNALLRTAPVIAKLNIEMKQGNRYKYNLSADISNAVKTLSALRDRGQSVDNYLSSQNMFSEYNENDETKQILQFLDDNKRKGNIITKYLSRAVKLINNLGDPKQISMIEEKNPTLSEILNRASNYATGKNIETNLFEEEATKKATDNSGQFNQKSEVKSNVNDSTDTMVTRDSQGDNQNTVGADDESTRTDGRDGNESIEQTAQEEGIEGQSSDNSISDSSTTSGGTSSDSTVRSDKSTDTSSSTRSAELSRSVADSYDGSTQLERGGTETTAQPTQERRIDERKLAKDVKENKALPKGRASRLQSIQHDLPKLFPEQQMDVLFAENRLIENKKAGVMFTNGTGTGKTYTGLGIIKRFVNQGKSNILIISPNNDINNAWIKAAKKDFGLTVTALKDTKDKGQGAVITTYANFRANSNLVNREWDLVLCDEAHRLMSNSGANSTAALNSLRAITYHHAGANERVNRLYSAQYDEYIALRNKLSADDGSEKAEKLTKDEENRYHELERFFFEKKRDEEKKIANMPEADKPKVVMLSASPFAHVENIDYAEGYLYNYDTNPNSFLDPRSNFYIKHFGYQIRNNQLTRPDANVNTDLLEINFNSWLKKTGALSGRVLVSDKDYDRGFILVDGGVGQKIDEGISYLRKHDNSFYALENIIMNKLQGNGTKYILEAVKAKNSVKLIQDYVKQGKKVVVFHDFNKNTAENPFVLTDKDFKASSDSLEAKTLVYNAKRQYEEFKRLRPDLMKLDLKDLNSPINVLSKAFGNNIAVLNGKASNTEKTKMIKDFNDDNSNLNIILIQRAAGREGISLHDTTGVHQRVLIDLGLPTRPVDTIQCEGRIYRVGVKTNAIFRYLNTGTFMEKIAFATTIASRAGTAENLGMGEQSRDLKSAFITAFLESDGGNTTWKKYLPGSKTEGIGGKELDRRAAATMNGYEQAKTYYYTTQKRTSATKSQEGVDYYATPEPVGYKMVEWADIKSGESVLEPSAGHGAIARFFPNDTKNTAIEPSRELASDVRMNLIGANNKIIEDTFEKFSINNKFDTIVMNPPYGKSSKTAMEHLEKAYKHLKDGGRIVALVPAGNSMETRFVRWLYGDPHGKTKADQEGQKTAVLMKSFLLPSYTFKRAGTSVMTRIYIIDKYENTDIRKQARAQRENEVDLRGGTNINDLFNAIENLNVPERIRLNDGTKAEITSNNDKKEKKTIKNEADTKTVPPETLEDKMAAKFANITYLIKNNARNKDDKNFMNSSLEKYLNSISLILMQDAESIQKVDKNTRADINTNYFADRVERILYDLRDWGNSIHGVVYRANSNDKNVAYHIAMYALDNIYLKIQNKQTDKYRQNPDMYFKRMSVNGRWIIFESVRFDKSKLSKKTTTDLLNLAKDYKGIFLDVNEHRSYAFNAASDAVAFVRKAEEMVKHNKEDLMMKFKFGNKYVVRTIDGKVDNDELRNKLKKLIEDNGGRISGDNERSISGIFKTEEQANSYKEKAESIIEQKQDPEAKKEIQTNTENNSENEEDLIQNSTKYGMYVDTFIDYDSKTKYLVKINNILRRKLIKKYNVDKKYRLDAELDKLLDKLHGRYKTDVLDYKYPYTLSGGFIFKTKDNVQKFIKGVNTLRTQNKDTKSSNIFDTAYPFFFVDKSEKHPNSDFVVIRPKLIINVSLPLRRYIIHELQPYRKAKQLRGMEYRYSRTSKGYVFDSEQSAKKFLDKVNTELEKDYNPRLPKYSGMGYILPSTINENNIIPENKLTKAESRMKEFGDTIGCPVVFFSNSKMSNIRGAFSGNVIYLNRASHVNPRWTFYHEFTHWLKYSNPDIFAQLRESIGEVPAKRITEYRKQIVGGEDIIDGKMRLTDEDIIEEMMADNMYNTTTRVAMNRLMAKNKPSLWQKFVALWHNFLDKFRELYSIPLGLDKTQGKNMSMAMEKLVTSIKDRDGKPMFKRTKDGLVFANGELVSNHEDYIIEPIDFISEEAFSAYLDDDLTLKFSSTKKRTLKTKLREVFKGRPSTAPAMQIKQALEVLSGYTIEAGRLFDKDSKYGVNNIAKIIRTKKALDYSAMLEAVSPIMAEKLGFKNDIDMTIYIAKYLYDVSSARNDVENFAKLKKAIDENNLNDKFITVQNLFSDLKTLSARELFRASRVNEDTIGKKGLSEKLHDMYLKQHDQWIDKYGPLQRLVTKYEKATGKKLKLANPYKEFRLMAGSAGLGQTFIEGKKDSSNEALQTIYKGIDFNNFKSLETIFSDNNIVSKDDMENLADYCIAMYEQEQLQQGKEVSHKKAAIEEIIKNTKDNIKAAQKDLLDYQHKLFEIMADSGLISREQMRIMEMYNKNYVPMYKYFDENDNLQFDTKLDNPDDVNRLTINPIEGIIANTYKTMRLAAKNKAKMSMVTLANDKTIAPYIKIERVANTGASTKTTFSVMVNGKKYTYSTSPEIMEMMNEINLGNLNFFQKILYKISSVMRAVSTFANPEFGFSNAIRDIATTKYYSKYSMKPIDLVHGFMSTWNKDKYFWEYMASGAAQTAAVSMDRNYTQASLNKIYRKEFSKAGKIKNFVLSPSQWLSALQYISEVSESGIRIAHYRAAKRAMEKDKSITLQDIAYETRDLMDFSRSGQAGRALNNYTMFANASIQGWSKFLRTMAEAKNNKERAGLLAFRFFKYAILPALVLFFWNKDDDKYQETPQWLRDSHWIITIGDKIIRIPKGMDPSIIMVSGLIERGLNYSFNKDKEAFNKSYTLLTNQLPNLFSTAANPIVESMANYSFFRDAPIVPASKEKDMPRMQYDQYTSGLSKLVGKMFNISPMKMDYMLYGYTGNYGRMATRALDATIIPKEYARAESPANIEDWLFLRRFMYTPYKNTRSLTKFYDDLNYQQALYNEYKDTGVKPDEFDERYYNRLKDAKSKMNDVKEKQQKLLEDTTSSAASRQSQLDMINKKRLDIARKVIATK